MPSNQLRSACRAEPARLSRIEEPYKRLAECRATVRSLHQVSAEVQEIRNGAIIELIEDFGWTQHAVAELLGISKQRITQIVQRHYGPGHALDKQAYQMQRTQVNRHG